MWRGTLSWRRVRRKGEQRGIGKRKTARYNHLHYEPMDVYTTLTDTDRCLPDISVAPASSHHKHLNGGAGGDTQYMFQTCQVRGLGCVRVRCVSSQPCILEEGKARDVLIYFVDYRHGLYPIPSRLDCFREWDFEATEIHPSYEISLPVLNGGVS
jgi:hypothetical protein